MLKKILFAFLFFIFFFFNSQPILAAVSCECKNNSSWTLVQNCNPDCTNPKHCPGTGPNGTTLYQQCRVPAQKTPGSSGTVKLTPPVTITSIPVLIGKIINALLGIVGSIALAMFIYGGFVWMTSAGSPEKTKQGQQVLLWATIGLAVIFSSAALVQLVFTGLGV